MSSQADIGEGLPTIERPNTVPDNEALADRLDNVGQGMAWLAGAIIVIAIIAVVGGLYLNVKIGQTQELQVTSAELDAALMRLNEATARMAEMDEYISRVALIACANHNMVRSQVLVSMTGSADGMLLFNVPQCLSDDNITRMAPLLIPDGFGAGNNGVE